MNILETLRRLQSSRRQEKITPDHVPEPELMRAINTEAREELNRFYADGKIGVTETVNARAIYIK